MNFNKLDNFGGRMTIKRKIDFLGLKTIVGLVLVLAVASCGGLRNPLTVDDSKALSSALSFDDRDLEKGYIGGAVTINIPDEILNKLVAAKKDVNNIEVYLVNDTNTSDFTYLEPVGKVSVEDLVSGLNYIGEIPTGTFKLEDDVVLLSVSSDSVERNEKNPINIGVFSAVNDAVGVTATERNVVTITTPELVVEEEEPVDETSVNIELSNVHFDFDRSDLTIEYQDQIAGEVSQYLSNVNRLRISIAGHCDERGTLEYNLALGQKRADAVKSYLISLGIPVQNIFTTSFGEEAPIDSSSNEEAWTKNRRAEINMLVTE